jgi:outer membrane biosynthesis protein TonB
MTWTPRDSATVPPFSDGITFLTRALSMARDSGLAFTMPAEVTADSVIFHIGLYTPTFTREGKVSHPSVESPVALFHVNQPPFEPAEVKKQVPPRYPAGHEREGVRDAVEVSFIVDTSGRVDKSTITDARPSMVARLTGERARRYKAFYNAVAKALESARYEPARIGSCPIRQRKSQRFEFKFG